jgi:endonuclease/exonuclease/phosphatase family metal-dependent hydrolase
MSYRIGSFNLQNFSGKTSKDLDVIINIIISERFDVIALQEVLNQTALTMILRRLPLYWEGSWAQPRSSKAENEYIENGDIDEQTGIQNVRHSINTAKGYAFLWNTKRLKECSKTGARIFDQIKNGELVRNPYYGRFTPAGLPGGSFFEIRLINVHLCSPAENKEARMKEFKLLTEEIYSRIHSKRYGINMPAYTIILGDYNMPISWCNECNGQGIITEQDCKTTLKRPASQEGSTAKITASFNPYKIAAGVIRNIGKITPATNISFIDRRIYKLKQFKSHDEPSDDGFYANDYDHFSYTNMSWVDIPIRFERVDAIKKYSKNDPITYRKEVSDHVPVLAELEINDGY